MKRNPQMRQFMDIARMPMEHATDEEVLSVSAAMAITGRAVREAWPSGREIAGTVAGLRKTERWVSGELLEYEANGRELVGRIPIGMRPAVVSTFARLMGNELADGQEVHALGIFEVSALYKPLRFIVERIELVNAVGEAQRACADIRRAIGEEGIGTANRERRCPERLSRVGLVHPIGGGAGLDDFLKKIESAPGVDLVVNRYPVAMQGADAGNGIAAAVTRAVSMSNEIVVIVRGGGPSSDLAAFDSEALCRAICSAPVPIVVGVGHASDQSLADEVAYASVPTPTAAAVWILERAMAHVEADEVERRRVEKDGLERRIQSVLDDNTRSHRRERIAIGCVAVLAVLLIISLIT